MVPSIKRRIAVNSGYDETWSAEFSFSITLLSLANLFYLKGFFYCGLRGCADWISLITLPSGLPVVFHAAGVEDPKSMAWAHGGMPAVESRLHTLTRSTALPLCCATGPPGMQRTPLHCSYSHAVVDLTLFMSPLISGYAELCLWI